MSDQQYKKLMRRFTVMWILFGVLVVLMILSWISQPRSNVQSIGLKGEPGQSIVGPMGPQGPAGEPGLTVIHETQVIAESSAVPMAGPKGDQGEPGTPGREIELQRNEETGDVEWRRSGDRFWQTLLPACELKASCGEEGNGPGSN